MVLSIKNLLILCRFLMDKLVYLLEWDYNKSRSNISLLLVVIYITEDGRQIPAIDVSAVDIQTLIPGLKVVFAENAKIHLDGDSGDRQDLVMVICSAFGDYPNSMRDR